ncbi:MAG: hemerythrin domain-containing protein [Hungatella sp.]|jgi:hemerythrin-like domain-containing protein|nr:hemerythrin domain-containing protein [Hungatella sp.]
MELKNYMEQHDRIREELEILKALCKNRDLEQTASETALHISSLAGKLKIHLSSEDQYLYPAFLRSGDSRLVDQAEEYQREMGNLLALFTEFKDKYNTKIKILSEKESFFGEAEKIIKSIEVRMQKEESGLYRLVR